VEIARRNAAVSQLSLSLSLLHATAKDIQTLFNEFVFDPIAGTGVCVCVCEREIVCVCERERDCMCVCEREIVCVCEREIVCVCVRERLYVCV
jgi:hypothetical protein